MKINTLFFDIGGVTLTNGWDHHSRIKAAEHFHIDYDEFNKKHKSIINRFEKGRCSLNEYLNKAVSFKKRNFSQNEFISFMKNQSKPLDTTIEILERLSKKKRYFLATINNESFELNNFRINKFHLNKYFTAFFSSSFLHEKKPGIEIFRIALNVLQKDPQECLFIDDRQSNIKGAKKAGLNTIHLKEPDRLEEMLINNDIII